MLFEKRECDSFILPFFYASSPFLPLPAKKNNFQFFKGQVNLTALEF